MSIVNIRLRLFLKNFINLVLVLLLVACSSGGGGGGGGGGSATTTISGTVSAPGGAIASLQQPTLLAKLLDGVFPPVTAAVTGTSGVASATVELIKLDGDGNQVGAVLVTTTTDAMGNFSLDTTESLSSTLVLKVTGGGGAEIHAMVVGAITDIDPITEYVYQLVKSAVVASPNVSMAFFSATEIENFIGAIENLTVDLTGQTIANALSALGAADSGALASAISSGAIPDLSGSWIYKETSGNNTCGDLVGVTVETVSISISQSGNSITVSVNGQVYATGSLVGNAIVGLPLEQYSEDGGITTETSQTFTVQGDNNTVNGTINWAWSGPGGTCTGTNSIIITRN